MTHPEQELKTLGLTDSETTVYLRMAAGARTARDLIKTTKMKRPTVYYALNSLEKRGLVSKSGKEGEATFALAPFERLVSIAKEKEDEAALLTEQIGELASSLKTSASSVMEKPLVAFFEGIDAVKHVVMDVMYAKGRQVDLIVPEKTFFWGFGEAFIKKYIEERKRRGIKTKNLWEAKIAPRDLKTYYSTYADIRLLPATMKGKFKTTIFLFDDKTLYVSSMENCYAVLITSKEHADTIRALFDGLWSIATPYKA